jgi:DNA replication protein DnaC
MQAIKDILAKYNRSTQGENSTLPSIVTDKPSYKCDLCQDKGIVLVGDCARPCQCMKQKELFKKFKHARMSDQLLQQSFAKFKLDYYSKLLADPVKNISYYENAQKALAGAKRFVEEYLESGNSAGLMFVGSVGCGKTFLACAIANALLEQDKQVLFLVVPDLLDELRATYARKDNDTTEQDLLDTARTVPVLVLDDLGAHNYTDWTINRIYTIINYRLNHRLPTIITTNLDIRQLNEFLGERTCSRLLEMCRGFELYVERDIRMLKYKERENRI